MLQSRRRITLATRLSNLRTFTLTHIIIDTIIIIINLVNHRSSWLGDGQAPWDTESCMSSMNTNGIYEASGLVLWLRTGLTSTGAGRDVDPGDVPLSEIEKFKANFFRRSLSKVKSFEVE